MTESTDQVIAQAKQMVEELQRTRDELRLQLHLASMEAKDAYHELEPKIVHFEARAHEIGDEPAHELQESFQHLRAALRSLREKLSA